MQVTKFLHACLLVETADRTALFDPGIWSAAALDIGGLTRLDDILITHQHPDHFDIETVKKLAATFPRVRITAPEPVVKALAEQGIKFHKLETGQPVQIDP